MDADYNEKKDSQVTRSGRVIWAAVVLVLAAGALTAGILSPSYMTRRHVKQVTEDWQALRVAMDAYGMDRCGGYFPPDTSTRRERLDPSALLTFECDEKWITTQPIGYERKAVQFWVPLTTPIAYAASIPRDPFHGGSAPGFFSFNSHDGMPLMAVLHSPGPDGRADIDLPLLRRQLAAYFEQHAFREWTLKNEDKGLIRQLIAPRLYDPTNGLRSGGDLVKVVWHGDGDFGFGEPSDRWAELPAPRVAINESDVSNPLRVAPEVCELVPALPLQLPRRFARALEAGGMSPMDYGPLLNHLGRDFGDFFDQPRLLTDSELAAFAAWRKEAPMFWQILFEPHTEYDWELPPDQFFALLPVLGKCLLLQSAEKLNDPHPGFANRGLVVIQDIIRRARPRCVEPLPPHQQRVFEELTRLSEAMRPLVDEAMAARRAAREAERAASEGALEPDAVKSQI